MAGKIAYSYLIALLGVAVGVAQAQTCEQLADSIEAKLFEQPTNEALLRAWQSLGSCSDKEINKTGLATKPTSYTLGVWRGYDTNPSYASVIRSLDLTTTQGVVSVPVAARVLGGQFSQLQLIATHTGEQTQTTYYVQSKQYDQSATEGQFLAGIEQNYVRGAHHVQLAGRSMSALGLTLRQAQLGYSYGLSEQWALTGEWRVRRFVDRDEFDGNAYLAGVRFGSLHYPVSVKLAVGKDNAVNARAGGDQELIEGSLNWHTQWQGHLFDVLYYLRQQHDGQGYSTLLSNNQTRQLLQQGVLVQWLLPSIDQLQPNIQFEYSEQQANIGLFAWQNTSVRAGLSWFW